MKLCSLLTLLCLFIPSIAGAWGNMFNGTAISTASNNQLNAVAVSDGAGGAIIAWMDTRNNNTDIFAQRVNAWGQVQWAADGVAVRVATNQQTNPCIVSDGAGGAIVFYEHLANNGSTNIEAQRINASGTQLWLNPTQISGAMNDQLSPRAVSDGAGGAIVVWQDNRAGSNFLADVYAQRVNGSGLNLWTTDGVAVCVAAQKETNARLVGDGSGGAIIAWSDFRDGSTWNVYTQRINSAGSPQWTPDGVLVGPDMGNENTAAIASDNAGGAIIAWHSDTDGDNDIYAVRVNPSGTNLWNIGGVSVCAAVQGQTNPQITPDGSGGAIVAWQDLRDSVIFTDDDLYAQRLNSSGGSMWTPNGNPVCTETGAAVFPQVISDGASGAIVVWTDDRFADYNLFAQRISATGSRLWTTTGATVIQANAGQTGPAPVTDGAYGMIVAWTDSRAMTNFDIYANRITGAGVIPTAVHDTPSLPALAVNVYPSPFSSTTSIEITSHDRVPVHAHIYDVSGRRVRSLKAAPSSAPVRTIPFDGRDEDGAILPSGVYFCRIQAGAATTMRKLVIQR